MKWEGELDVALPRKARDTLYPPGYRWRVLYGGRDSAKSWSIARALIGRGIAKPERVLCTREVQKSIAESVHQLLCDQIRELGVEDYYDIQNAYIHGVNGTQFSFHGLSGQTANSIKSFEGTTICWVEEAQTISARSWNLLEPTIRTPGSEIWVSFNPDMDTDATYRRFVTTKPPNALITLMNFYDNPWRSTVLDASREQMKRDAPEDYAHIYLGQCRPAVEGAIYYKEVAALRSSGRLCRVPYDPMLKVHVVCDLGYNDFMSMILVQRMTAEIRVIGYIEDRQRTIPSYNEQLQALKYNWGQMWLPHDARAKTLTAASNPLGATAQEQFERLGWSVEIVQDIDVDQGIRKAREIFPRVYMDESATDLLSRLGRYRRHITADGRAGMPVHDDQSHGADGFRYLALVADQLTNEKRVIPANPYAAFQRAAAW